MDYKEIKKLLDKYLDGESSLKDEALLKAWFANRKNIPAELRWAGDIFGYTRNQKQERKAGIYRNLIKFSVAASIAVLISIFLITKNYNELKTFTNTENEITEIQIDEYCHVWLNRNSTITYSTKSTTNINIDGEAFFELSQENKKTYYIQAHNAVIQTQKESAFNVNAYDSLNSIEVAIREGSLKVTESGNEVGMALLVDKGKYCSVHRSSKMMYSSVISNNNYMAWKTGELNFTNQPLKTVTDALAEYYQVEIIIDNRDLSLCSYSGSFKNKSLEVVLEEIRKEKEFQIKTTGNVISLSGGNCITN